MSDTVFIMLHPSFVIC